MESPTKAGQTEEVEETRHTVPFNNTTQEEILEREIIRKRMIQLAETGLVISISW